MGGLGQRPLSEVSPMAQRRNSPIWNTQNQTTKTQNGDPPSYDVSSLNSTTASQRRFWKGRESPSPFSKGGENQLPYNPDSCYKPTRRPSLEDLKRVSRVKNNNMFRGSQQEYDPAHVSVPQRPLAANRAPNLESQMNLAKSQFAEDDDSINIPRPHSPSKEQPSPSKSSLSKGSRFGKSFDPQSDIWYDSAGHRHTKSVTFDAAPPQVNEYEMRTPDPSSLASESREASYDSEQEEEASFEEYESSIERDDSFDASLEDIEKTPVVLPDDWRFMSPGDENDDEESFVEHAGNQTTEDRPVSRDEDSAHHESLDANDERRPLPPLPSVSRLSSSRSLSPEKLAGVFELGSGSLRGLPSPLVSAAKKSDPRASMCLEDRLRLLMLEEKTKGFEHNEEELDVKDLEPSTEDITIKEEEKETSMDDFFSPPRISRDSILKGIRKGDSYEDDGFDDESHIASSPNPYANHDPDVPIPSLEMDDDDNDSMVFKEEADDDDLYKIPDYKQSHSDRSLSSLDQRAKYDEESNYSLRSALEAAGNDATDKSTSQTTPIADVCEDAPSPKPNESDEAPASEVQPLDMALIRRSLQSPVLQRPVTPELQEEAMSEPSTPGSVIRHPVADSEEDYSEEEEEEVEESCSDEAVPEPVATIRAPGATLKTRPSLTPADIESMAATRRRISGQHPPSISQPVPQLTKQLSNESTQSDNSQTEAKSADDASQLTVPSSLAQRKSSLMQLDIPFSIQEESLGFGLTKEFDRVIESQKVAFHLALSKINSRPVTAPQEQTTFRKQANLYPTKQRGYLMRQNTKVVIASNRHEEEPALPNEQSSEDPRGTKSAGSSPRKASQQTWTTVPWNGSPRRPSVKVPTNIPKKKPVSGVVPPLPGQESAVQEAPSKTEESEPLVQDTYEEGEERGRLFVKVVGIKYMDLPLPRAERSYFALTLDNGLHCVTTSWLELGKSAPIGQEFELVVQNELEFQLTLQMKVDENRLYPQELVESPARQKPSAFGRMFASPRRRKEIELQQQMKTQQPKDVNAPVWEKLRNTVARDGSFARAYVSLTDHEEQAFGRPYTVDIACFNEWATDEQPSSVKSKKSAISVTAQRRPPYKIGKLELQLLFVPKPKGSKEEEMPKSINACIREMREAESVSTRTYEGFLSQQGGDCPFWRRRFFKLQGSKLTAYHESTRQPRATINLAKAAKLIDDRPSLTKETNTKTGGRRKSAFAEEEDGYMFVEEGFRIRFANGEVIDFYADSAKAKDGWLRVMSEAVGKGGSSSSSGSLKPWADLVLKRERSMKNRPPTAERPPSGLPAPPRSPVRQSTAMAPPPPSSQSAAPSQSHRPRHKHANSQPELPTAEARRQKTRSLIY
ncbi:hypothetical protein N7495_008758 [Penicillium taxi]|uniref:uncharacterized protein n=1 Tax=Penicillium taxi TaxID=168475 RepID=UPI002545B2F7|nr:uncharacterized protein N7495_008758 [Penicillium taxi]KAJ5888717.1 hypothetical protein N7495_008758 [Penicillium taxi]